MPGIRNLSLHQNTRGEAGILPAAPCACSQADNPWAGGASTYLALPSGLRRSCSSRRARSCSSAKAISSSMADTSSLARRRFSWSKAAAGQGQAEGWPAADSLQALHVKTQTRATLEHTCSEPAVCQLGLDRRLTWRDLPACLML